MGKILEGKSALVTGGGGGFGKASARLLVRDGASVVLTGRTLATLEKAREKLLGEFPDGKIAIIAGDATKEADVKAAYDDGLDETEVRREFAKFKDFWRAKPGKDGMKLDWNATFRNWMRRAADDKRQRANGRVQQGQSRARH